MKRDWVRIADLIIKAAALIVLIVILAQVNSIRIDANYPVFVGGQPIEVRVRPDR